MPTPPVNHIPSVASALDDLRSPELTFEASAATDAHVQQLVQAFARRNAAPQAPCVALHPTPIAPIESAAHDFATGNAPADPANVIEPMSSVEFPSVMQLLRQMDEDALHQPQMPQLTPTQWKLLVLGAALGTGATLAGQQVAHRLQDGLNAPERYILISVAVGLAMTLVAWAAATFCSSAACSRLQQEVQQRWRDMPRRS